jgi:hypothetical protein
MILVLLSGLIPVFYGTYYSKVFAAFPILLMTLFMKNWKRIYFGPVDAALNISLAKTGVYLLLYGILFGIILIT